MGAGSEPQSSREQAGCSQLSCITILSGRRYATPFANKMFTGDTRRHLPLLGASRRSSLGVSVVMPLRYKASSRVFLLFSNVAAASLTLKLRPD